MQPLRDGYFTRTTTTRHIVDLESKGGESRSQGGIESFYNGFLVNSILTTLEDV